MYKCLYCGERFEEPSAGKPDPFAMWGMMHPECPACGGDDFEEEDLTDEEYEASCRRFLLMRDGCLSDEWKA